MAVICPSITANNAHQYREQIERIAAFATKVHLDFMDSTFAPVSSPSLEEAWWPHTMQADIHLMYREPTKFLETLIKMNPRLVVVHAEAEGSFVEFSRRLHEAGIIVGVALLQDTKPRVIKRALEHIDHVLIFSGKLGYFGGTTDLNLLNKVKQLKELKHDLEFGWDGGINDENAKQLIEGGVDVLNVGGFIQHASNPAHAYAKLQEVLERTQK